ncbi:MAG: D-2-hydroxyacid dehydrogenase [Gudongella sp.]|nr:D-2-hydroxyacid dehydrogenase [Gudongella sp.]
MVHILATDGIDKNAILELNKLGHKVTEQFYNPEELGDALKDYDVVVVRSATKIREPIIDKAVAHGKLKMVIRAGVGLDNIDVNYAKEKGLDVRNTPNSSSASVAELALAHMFCLARFVAISNVTMRNGEWNKKAYKGIELSGKTLGLIGFGRISSQLAIKAHALGMKVIYTNRSGIKDGYPDYEYMKMEDLFKHADFISIHTPATKDGKPLISTSEIKQMKDGVYLINCARGGIIDEDALLDALDSGKVAGAGIDVFSEEPTKNEKLVNHKNVSVTPHIGGSTDEAQERIGEEIVDIIKSNF